MLPRNNIIIVIGIFLFTLIILNRNNFLPVKEKFTEQEQNEIKDDIEFLKKQVITLRDNITTINKSLKSNTKDLCDIKKILNEFSQQVSEGDENQKIDLPFSNFAKC